MVLPNDYHGLVLLCEDQSSEVELQNKDTEYQIAIPENGEICLKSLKAMNQWHKITARYKDGRTLKDEASANNSEDAIFEMPYVRGRGCYYFVGTKDDYNKISRNPAFYKLPLAKKM